MLTTKVAPEFDKKEEEGGKKEGEKGEKRKV